MKNKILSILLGVMVVINFCFITSVNAATYEENAFTDGVCVKTDAWQATAKTGYTLNTTTGLYELTGDAYNETNAATTHIYYMISPDGKVLGAFVPKYSTLIADTTTQTELFNKGIVTTATCDGTYVMLKTVVGNPPTEESVIAGIEEAVNNDSDDKTSTEDDTTTTNPNEEGSENSVEKMASPNTASPMATAAVFAGVVLISVAVYGYFRKTRPELFKSNK